MDKHNLKYQPYEILDRVDFSSDIILLTLKGKINFKPGQFVQASLDHYGEVTLAVCSDPSNKKTFDLCIRGCGITTNQMINLLPGDSINVRGPYGNSWPEEKLIGKNVILIAGGMGIVPIRPLIMEILRKKRKYKKIHFIAGFKTPENILFADDLELWKKQFNSYDLYTEHTSPGYKGKLGLITEPIKKGTFDPKSVALICGPEIMFSHCAEALIEKGIDPKNIYVSFERRMECGIGICQHCNVGKFLVCKDGPIFRWDIIKEELNK